jgi:hypothetical protein
MVVDEDDCYPAQTHVPDGTMHAVEARDSRPTGSTLYAPEHDVYVRLMCMFGRIEYFSK